MADQPKKLDLMEWMNPESDNFCGSGMTMRDWMMSRGIQRYQRSWGNQERPEQNRRLRFVMDMTLEMRRIQQEYGTCVKGTWYVAAGASMERAIEAVITGEEEDLIRVKEMYEPKFFCWNYNDEEQGMLWAGRYAKFVELCDQCLATWPTEEEKAQA
jgi:hypothetical protein